MLTYQAHSAPMAMAFYILENGRAVGIEDFLTGPVGSLLTGSPPALFSDWGQVGVDADSFLGISSICRYLGARLGAGKVPGSLC